MGNLWYLSYLIDLGIADICFPSDFHYLKHAYKHITGRNADVLKNQEMFDKYSLPTWWETMNGFNPMRDEYINTSLLLS